jgi:hypothetical protein
VTLDLLLGRGLAFFAHPVLAWQRLRPQGRALLAAAYFAGSYAAVLTTLFLL